MTDMKNDIHNPSRMLTLAGGLMTLSGILMAVSGKLAIGGMFWAAASCMFVSAWHNHLAENKKDRAEESSDESETV